MQDIATFIALHRFGLGAKPGEGGAVARDPRGWAKAQIKASATTPASLSGFRSSEAIVAELHTARIRAVEALRDATRAAYRSDFAPEALARARLAIATDQPFRERMVLFLSNHFTVSIAKSIVGPTIPAFEREAIRPHVFGRFADMLKAVSRHPSMLSYLDNMISIGPNSDVGRRRRAANPDGKTLNENLAREILELHTLGVDGGYGQQDVIELAKAISGWNHGGIRPRRDPRPVHGRFEFKDYFHEPGPKTVLGRTYAEAGDAEGLAVLDDLARHPSTAKHIATKLARHFVADDPPADAVWRIGRALQDSDGDLAVVSRTLIDLERAWRHPLAKAKTHYEYVIAVHRALGNADAAQRDIGQPLREMGQTPFSAPSPQGWSDVASHWVAPIALLRRNEWARRFAGAQPASVRPERLLEETIGAVASEATRRELALAPSGDAALALLFASPEFQRR